MSPTWHSDDLPAWPRPGIAGWIRVLLRGVPLALLVFGGLLIHLMVRLVERPFCGANRPATPHITMFVCRNALRLIGIRFERSGKIADARVALVANHVSWLDIFVLNACTPLYFVSKSEVAGWPGIGWLARATGTVFIDRDRAQARSQTAMFIDRLNHGHRLLFFPEGTSTDGRRVLTFKPTLFAAFFEPSLNDHLSVQPLSLIYTAPPGADPRFYGWWGDMGFEAHLLQVLAAPTQGSVNVIVHPLYKVSEFDNRKTLAAALEERVRAGVENGL